jgi:hypothetical protein
LTVHIVREFSWPYGGTYGGGKLTLNVGRLGHSFFEGDLERINRMLLHEFGHEFSSDHLSEEYHDALCKLGAKLAALALTKSELFKI